jgi:hypothetical protein
MRSSIVVVSVADLALQAVPDMRRAFNNYCTTCFQLQVRQKYVHLRKAGRPFVCLLLKLARPFSMFY